MARKFKLAGALALAGAGAGAVWKWAQDKPGAGERGRIAYPPTDALKSVWTDLWIVDSGPIRPMGLAVPVRMTVIRLTDGRPAASFSRPVRP